MLASGRNFFALTCIGSLLISDASALPKSSANNKHQGSQSNEVSLESVAVPQPEEACFSPDERCDLKVIRFIQTAEKSVDIAAFDLTLDSLAHHLLVQAKKIPVRVLVDRRQANGKHSLVSVLLKAGVDVRIGVQRGLMHHKFIVIDQKALELGSFNYTHSAYKKNQENQLYLWTPKVVAQYQGQFNRMWVKAMKPKVNSKPKKSDHPKVS